MITPRTRLISQDQKAFADLWFPLALRDLALGSLSHRNVLS